MNERSITRLVLAASAGMLLFMCRPLLTGQLPFTGDLLHFHYPLRDFYSRALANGHHFDWMPSFFTGFYVVGEGQIGAYHPLHWLLYRFVALDPAFDLELVASYPFMFAGMWVFLRRWCDQAPAVFGAMVFTFCGFNLSHGVHINIVAIVAHIPWLLWAIHSAFAAEGRRALMRWCAVIGLLTGSQLLLGHPQTVWFSVLIEGAYTTLLLASSRYRVAAGGTVLLGKLLGVAVAAIQVLATLHLVQHSVRSTFDATYATTFSLPPMYLLQLLAPYGLWGRVTRWTELPQAGDEFSAYGGAVTLILAVWWVAVFVSQRDKRRTTVTDRFGISAAAVGVLGLWLATGSHGRLYYVQTWLPFVQHFRAPVRYLLFTQLALAVLAAIGLARLVRCVNDDERCDWRTLWAPWALVFASMMSSAWLAWNASEPVSVSPQRLQAVLLGPILFAAAAALLTSATRGARWAVAGLVLLAIGDQGLYGLGGVIAWQDFLTRPQVIRLLGTGESLPPTAPARVMCCEFPNLYAVAGYRLLDGYVALPPFKVLNYRRPHALQAAQVQYARAGFKETPQIAGAQPINGDWLRLPPTLSRVALMTESRVSVHADIDLEEVDVARVALSTRELHLPGGPAGTARIVRDDPGDLGVKTITTDRQLLVVSESFDDGWIATVDGQTVSVEQIDGDFMGCLVPAGEHDVSLQFRPAHLRWGGAISLGGVVVDVLLVVFSLI